MQATVICYRKLLVRIFLLFTKGQFYNLLESDCFLFPLFWLAIHNKCYCIHPRIKMLNFRTGKVYPLIVGNWFILPRFFNSKKNFIVCRNISKFPDLSAKYILL